jgi:phosphohistidine phosphatase
MKSVLLIRHAKSSWDSANITDFERPLNERGKRDAPEMANRLKKRNIKIDAFISSPAKRARKTAELFMKELKERKTDIILIDELYHADPDVFRSVILKTDDKFDCIAIFSHNPGITDFVNTLTSEVRTDNMPTCAVFAIRTPITSWKDFKEGNSGFWFFDYPKMV